MSHVFEALRKSEGHGGNGDFLWPDAFSQPIENTAEFESIASVNAVIRPESRLVVWDNPHSLAADRYRVLRIHLEKMQGAGRLRSLLLTSPSTQDGKTTVALNLATALAAHGTHKVLVLEADLRCPRVIPRLGLKPWEGLADCLAQSVDPLVATRRIEPFGFYLLPAGAPADNPTELLQSEELTQLVRSLSGRFDWILIDSPPTSPIADTLALKPRADACLLVARAGKTPREAVEEAIRQFGPEFVVGIVVNGLEGLDKVYSAYYTKYYGPESTKRPATAAKP